MKNGKRISLNSSAGCLAVYPVFLPVILLVLVLLPLSVHAQGLGALEEEKSFYTNYATDSYSKEIIEERLNEYFDLFGNYITDGYFIYSLSNDRQLISNGNITDSTISAISNEHRDEVFFENFSNICVSQDAIGGLKTAFIIGDQIRTKFAPLTFNKRNFEGIRWDLFYEGLGMTALISRTRPGLMARSYENGMGYEDENTQNRDSYVLYPSVSGGVYNNANELWNLSTENYVDLSARTAYGDYDFLWAMYAHKRFMDKIDVGVSYVNHHHSDVSKGEKWHGDIPDALAPGEIHFEFYDATHNNFADPGVKIHNITMTVVTASRTYSGIPPAAFYEDRYSTSATTGEVKHILTEVPVSLPYRKSGPVPAICTFHPKEAVGADSSVILDISFNIDVSGNYLVFVSTDRVGLMNGYHWLTSDDNAYYKQKQIHEITSSDDPDSFSQAIDLYDQGSEVYIGDYIMRSSGLAGNDDENRTSMVYHYRIPLARVVYGIDVSGELFNVDFDGELALNMNKSKFPSAKAEGVGDYCAAGYLKGVYPLNDKTLLRGNIFNIDADYQPYLSTYHLSRFLHTSKVGSPPASQIAIGSNRYDYPYILGNNYSVIDDNEDDDFFVDNERRLYHSNLSKRGGSFYANGAYKSPRTLSLPVDDSTFAIVYDDDDGVISERYDRNKNGVLDYEEDFLLYSADPPKFDLEADDNNNEIPDGQEDDIYPDYPVQPLYVYTSNGYKSLGVRGVSLAAEITVNKNTSLTVGGDYKTATSPMRLDKSVEDFDLADEAITDAGRMLQGYARLLYRITRRDLGVNVFCGQELKYVRDGIADDVVQSEPNSSGNVVYHIQTDPLRYRNAMLSRTSASFTFLNIPGFELALKTSAKLEKHFAVEQRVNKAYTFKNEMTGKYEYEFDQLAYKETSIGEFNGVLKMGAKIKPPASLPVSLGFLDGFELMPQYKLMYDYSVSSDENPRENEAFDKATSLYSETDSRLIDGYGDVWRDIIREWHQYSDYNMHGLTSVPIIRLTYPLGDRTMLDCGIQWKRKYDAQVAERSYLKQNRVAQIIISDNYFSFNLAVVIGWLWEYTDYTVNRYEPLYRFGKNWDERRSEVFCKIFMGN